MRALASVAGFERRGCKGNLPPPWSVLGDGVGFCCTGHRYGELDWDAEAAVVRKRDGSTDPLAETIIGERLGIMREPQPFLVEFSDTEVQEMRRRVELTRWPEPRGDSGWKLGTDAGFLRRLCSYWSTEFDWRQQERRLNAFPQFLLQVGAAKVHFVHIRAANGNGIPLILGHGWPSAFTEYLPVIPYLVDPESYGLDGPSFDIVIPSLPGYGFSDRPDDRSWNYAETAHLWHELMQSLGYAHFAAGGTDFGSGVVTMMAIQHPERLLGLHLSNLEISPPIDPDRPLSPAETSYTERSDRWWDNEGGYKHIQSTKPATLAVALTDSPAGLAAWIVEKWIGWADTRSDPENYFDRDELLTTISLYWLTRTIGSSILDYSDNRADPPKLRGGERVTVPTRLAVFTDPAGDPPREWIERLYEHVGLSPMPRGGHFAATEEPLLLATDIVRFFASDAVR